MYIGRKKKKSRSLQVESRFSNHSHIIRCLVDSCSSLISLIEAPICTDPSNDACCEEIHSLCRQWRPHHLPQFPHPRRRLPSTPTPTAPLTFPYPFTSSNPPPSPNILRLTPRLSQLFRRCQFLLRRSSRPSIQVQRLLPVSTRFLSTSRLSSNPCFCYLFIYILVYSIIDVCCWGWLFSNRVTFIYLCCYYYLIIWRWIE